MVSRPASLRQRAACRIRHGYRALHRMDVRNGAYSRDDSVSANALSAETIGTYPPRFRVGLLPDYVSGAASRTSKKTMRRLLFLGLFLISSANCANRQAVRVNKPAVTQTPAMVQTSRNTASDDSNKP